MSSPSRILTTRDDEKIIAEILAALTAKLPPVAKLHKWYILRLAMTFSFSLVDEPLPIPDDDARGGDYDLHAVTGEGKKEGEDLTDLFRAVLSVRHKKDLFHRVTGNRDFKDLLERHIHRGLAEFKRRWRDRNIHEFLTAEFSRFAGVSAAPLEPATPPIAEETIATALREIGIRCEVQGVTAGPRLTRYRLQVPVQHYDTLHNSLDKLAFSLGLARDGLTLVRSAQRKELELFVPRSRETWYRYQASDLRSWATGLHQDEPRELPVWPGVTVLGDPYVFDLAEAPHLFVAGTTGSGKSVCLHALICSLLLARSAQRVKLCLIDTKQTELAAYRGVPHLWEKQVFLSKDEAIGALEKVIQEMERRQTDFVGRGVRDIMGANLQTHTDSAEVVPRLVVVVEELADLAIQGGQIVEELLVRIAQKGRAAGIHLILSTQRPDAKTFSGLLRSNIPSRIALTVQKATESKIILDDLGAERLLKPGDMLVRLSGGDPVRVHGLLLNPEDVARIVNDAK